MLAQFDLHPPTGSLALRCAGTCDLVVFGDDTYGLRRHVDEVHRRVVGFLEELERSVTGPDTREGSGPHLADGAPGTEEAR